MGNSINEMTQSIDLFILVEDSLVRDGMYVSGEIICDSLNNSYKIERTKITNQNNVFVLKNDTIYNKSIDVVLFQNDSVIIQGVNDNDCIIDKYRHYFYDGMPVN